MGRGFGQRTWWQHKLGALYQPDTCTSPKLTISARMGKNSTGTTAAQAPSEKATSTFEHYRAYSIRSAKTRELLGHPKWRWNQLARRRAVIMNPLSPVETPASEAPGHPLQTLADMTTIAADIKTTLKRAITEEVKGIFAGLDEVLQAGTVRDNAIACLGRNS